MSKQINSVKSMLIACKDIEQINSVKSMLKKMFEMKEVGAAKRILGMKSIRDRINKILYLSQKSYISKVLKMFEIERLKAVNIPIAQHLKLSVNQIPKIEEEKSFMQKMPHASLVGSIMYGMVCTRFDLTHLVSLVSRFMSNLDKHYRHAIKGILQYLAGTQSLGLQFGKNVIVNEIMGYVDSNYVGYIDTKKFLTSFVFTSFGGPVS